MSLLSRSGERTEVMQDVLQVYYAIDDEIQALPTTVFLQHDEDGELISVHFEVQDYRSAPTSCSELAVKNLQRALPSNMKITACQTCMFGNFNPYGDMDNEIFCLKGFVVRNKMEVCEIIQKAETHERKRTLLAFCADYKPIDNKAYYTYNDWNI